MYQSPSAEHFALCPVNQVRYEQFMPLAICFSQCLPLAIPHPQLGNFFCIYSIFVVLGDSEGIHFANRTNIAAICCTRLHRLREYRSALLNTPGGGIIISLFMVRRLLGDNGISLLMSLRDLLLDVLS